MQIEGSLLAFTSYNLTNDFFA